MVPEEESRSPTDQEIIEFFGEGEGAWREVPPGFAIPETPGGLTLSLKPRRFSWRRSSALLETTDGRRVAVMESQDRGWEHARIKFASIIPALVGAVFFENRPQIDQIPENVVKEIRQWYDIAFKFIDENFELVVGGTLALSSFVARLVLSRKPTFRFKDTRNTVLYTAKFHKSTREWLIQGPGTPVFSLKLDSKKGVFSLNKELAQPDSGSDDEGRSALQTPQDYVSLEIPVHLKTGVTFQPSDKRGFKGLATHLRLVSVPVGNGAIRVPDWRSEEFTLHFKGPAFAPRDVLAFATYIARTATSIPIDIILLIGLGMGGSGIIDRIMQALNPSKLTEYQ